MLQSLNIAIDVRKNYRNTLTERLKSKTKAANERNKQTVWDVTKLMCDKVIATIQIATNYTPLSNREHKNYNFDE